MLVRILAIVVLMIGITSCCAWADGYRSGSEPYGYHQQQYAQASDGSWYQPGTEPYGYHPSGSGYGPVDQYTGSPGYTPEYRKVGGTWYRPGTDPIPGNSRYGYGRQSRDNKTALYIVGAAVIIGLLANRHNETPARDPESRQPAVTAPSPQPQLPAQNAGSFSPAPN